MIDFMEVGRLPVAGDNVAIATRRLEAGIVIRFETNTFALSHTVLEGHRFAVMHIEAGGLLTSWDMPFGKAIRSIAPGEYVCNPGVLEALAGRSIDFALPAEANFTDEIPPFEIEEARLVSGQQVAPAKSVLHFDGFDRGKRGAGTRNHVAIVGASSRTAGFVRRLAAHCNPRASGFDNVDGVVPVAHTEGEDAVQHNRMLVLRTLAGFMVHPNVGAVLVIDHAAAGIKSEDLQAYLAAQHYPVDADAVRYMTLEGAYAVHFDQAVAQVDTLLGIANKTGRTQLPANKLKIALQCGGSDAFSGISGNPLAGWVAREIVAQGGGANLAETDELIGAESYVLKNVKSPDVAKHFLSVVNRFQERAARHGSSAAGNPSGGNKFRGLYNIYLKSLGAAMKRDPAVRLDAVIEYGELMESPGFYFMDSPGNDLESIAGQVAAGCNMIFFVTGNGSITNFPFVPTLKVVTTTARYKHLTADMDVNAGEYLDGLSMDTLGSKMLAETLRVASGAQSVGEKAGHAQVQLWRNWRLNLAEQAPVVDAGATDYPGIPIPIDISDAPAVNLASSPASVGLVLPTSLCSGQISEMATAKLNAMGIGRSIDVERFVSVVHTEGCGASSGASEKLFLRTICGHLMHPAIKHALLLEHGCEKTHNDYFRNYLEAEGVDTTRYGWASIQQDGGIAPVLEKITGWFGERQVRENASSTGKAASVGILVAQNLSDALVDVLGRLTKGVVKANGTIVVPHAAVEAGYVQHPLLQQLRLAADIAPTIHYGQRILRPGFHAMAAPTWHEQELLAGLGATGVDVILVISDAFAVPAHPFIPVLQLGTADGPHADWWPAGSNTFEALLNLIEQTLTKTYLPKSTAAQHVDFQISRGWRGISL
ncbi:MAG: UxaA family hydrolase [Bacteroidota bacterium]